VTFPAGGNVSPVTCRFVTGVTHPVVIDVTGGSVMAVTETGRSTGHHAGQMPDGRR
jgi:hypothetical protein